MYWYFLFAGIAASLSLFLSKPEKKILAYITVCIIFLLSGWQAYDTYQVEKAKNEVLEHLTKRLSGKTQNYLTLIRDMIFYSSDGWLPKTEKEFFSSNRNRSKLSGKARKELSYSEK